jgi:uncharacterized protein YjbJ (UPF0337 family)
VLNRDEEIEMNLDRIEGNWRQFKGKVKERWGKLTDDELDVIAGKRDQLSGTLQKAYGTASRRTKPNGRSPISGRPSAWTSWDRPPRSA